MSTDRSGGDDVRAVAAAARRILEAYGAHETSASARVVYTSGDLNVAVENDVIEIINRGTLVFRYTPEGGAAGQVFEEHGDWRAEVERLAAAAPTT
jgi:hypothetical protein